MKKFQYLRKLDMNFLINYRRKIIELRLLGLYFFLKFMEY